MAVTIDDHARRVCGGKSILELMYSSPIRGM